MSRQYDIKKVLAIILADKGGVGKSFIAQIVHEMMKGPDEQHSVFCIDSDVGNSSTKQIFPDAEFAGVRDANDIASVGVITKSIRDLGNGVLDGVIWDTAAGSEEIVMDSIMPILLRLAAKCKIKIVVYRPITTSQYTQDGAVAFAEWAKENDVAVVFVRNLGQGRAAKYFADWAELPDRKAVMPPAVEATLPDLGCWIADEAASLRLSLGDVALARFDRLTEKGRAVADRKFTPAVQMAVADWLEMRCDEFAAITAEAIANISKKSA